MPNVSDFGMVERRQNFSFALTYTARTDKGDDFTRSNLRPCQERHCVGMILAYFRPTRVVCGLLTSLRKLGAVKSLGRKTPIVKGASDQPRSDRRPLVLWLEMALEETIPWFPRSRSSATLKVTSTDRRLLNQRTPLLPAIVNRCVALGT